MVYRINSSLDFFLQKIYCSKFCTISATFEIYRNFYPLANFAKDFCNISKEDCRTERNLSLVHHLATGLRFFIILKLLNVKTQNKLFYIKKAWVEKPVKNGGIFSGIYLWYTGQVTFIRHQNHTTMINWSPCILTSMVLALFLHVP